MKVIMLRCDFPGCGHTSESDISVATRAVETLDGTILKMDLCFEHTGIASALLSNAVVVPLEEGCNG